MPTAETIQTTGLVPRSPLGLSPYAGLAPLPPQEPQSALTSDTFSLSSDPEVEARLLAQSISDATLELRGVRFSGNGEARDYALNAGQLRVGHFRAFEGDRAPVLSRVDMRLTKGAYSVDFSVSEDGGVKIRKIYKDGRSVTSLLGDELKRKIEADPALWGTLTALAATGAVVAAHSYVKKTGDPIRFDVFDAKVAESGPWSLRVRGEAELTGKSSFVRSSGAGTALAFEEGAMRAELGVRYRRDEKWVATASASYAFSENTYFQASAEADRNDYRVGISFVSEF